MKVAGEKVVTIHYTLRSGGDVLDSSEGQEPMAYIQGAGSLIPMLEMALLGRSVAAAHWQAARTLGDYALTGCTVGPGFDFEDFTMLGDDEVSAGRLLALDPGLASLV
jgi:predicted cupin superfamily sugar epimerase